MLTRIFSLCLFIVQVYVGNYEYDADERELEKTFDKYGRVKTIEYKSGRRPSTDNFNLVIAPPS